MTVDFTPTSALADVVFGLDLLAGLGTPIDILGIYNGGTQVFQKARPLKASVLEPSRIMKHPAETGVMLADHQVIDPVEIDLPLVIPAQYYAATYQQIIQARNAATLLSVKTPVNVYQNMIISKVPLDFSPEHFNAVIITLRLEQVLFEIPGSAQPLPANYSTAAPEDQNTVQSGLVSGAQLGTQLLAGATGIVSYAATARKFF